MPLKKIKHCRKEKGLTQIQLAKLSGLSRSSIINLENGHRDPRVKDLRNIARALDVPIEQLLSGNEQEGN